ncbi:MAG: glycosyltransferase family 2 protein [Deltaproteobacteria bacterium]|nr:glycosyltransferase family 2 protein [Deltaproteobacteria bacterium]
MTSRPTVSVIIPCRQEQDFIGPCLDSILTNDYPKERLEVLVIDGMSTDNTRNIVNAYANRHPFIRLLDNSRREQQLALNIGIKTAGGEIIMRMDAHSTYKRNYISECIKALNEQGADNVGGRWVTVPRDGTFVGRAIAFVTSVPFGVGNAYYRLASLDRPNEPALNHPKWEINVAYFCCRKQIFDKIGLFNERLDRSEDIDFRSRLKKGGYRTLFVPTIECYYAMRTKFTEFIRHMFKNGLWVLLPLNYAPNVSFSLRHIVPLLFVSGILGTFFLAIFGISLPILMLLASYFLASLYYSFRIAARERDFRYFFLLPFLFLALHISYGLGSIAGLLRLIATKMRNVYVE